MKLNRALATTVLGAAAVVAVAGPASAGTPQTYTFTGYDVTQPIGSVNYSSGVIDNMQYVTATSHYATTAYLGGVAPRAHAKSDEYPRYTWVSSSYGSVDLRTSKGQNVGLICKVNETYNGQTVTWVKADYRKATGASTHLFIGYFPARVVNGDGVGSIAYC